MKVTDALGNVLMRGQKLYWKEANLYVTVREVTSVSDGKVAALKLELDMGVPMTKDSAQFPMFVRVVDPDAEEVVHKALGIVR